MEYIEQKTPKGIHLKIIIKKGKFLAFDQTGASIYEDEHKVNLMHNIPDITFFGVHFFVKNNFDRELSFLKVSKGKLIVPYEYSENDVKKYLFLDYSEKIDLLPVRLKTVENIQKLVRGIETGQKPDIIIVDRDVTKSDVIVVKNRCSAKIILVKDSSKGETEVGFSDDKEEEMASEIHKDVDLNLMSQNPVFLARVHLRDMSIVRVKQLLLDFDLTALETEYILNFIKMLLKSLKDNPDKKREVSELQSLKGSFHFYLFLLNRNSDEIKKLVESANNTEELVTYSTLLTKIKVVSPNKEDQLRLTDYENVIWEVKERLKKE